MARYSDNFLRWANYFAGPDGAAFDPEGLAQFHAYESQGVRPERPSPYFLRLDGGRSMFNAMAKEVRESYCTDRWQGWFHDAGTMPRWLFAAFYGWHPGARDGATSPTGLNFGPKAVA